VIEPILDEVLAGLDGIDDVLFEAPQKQQQDYFVTRFGPNVNLANIRPSDTLVLEALRCGLRFETLRRYVGEGVPWEGDDV
jgi:phosphosulfolactate synthase